MVSALPLAASLAHAAQTRCGAVGWTCARTRVRAVHAAQKIRPHLRGRAEGRVLEYSRPHLRGGGRAAVADELVLAGGRI